MRYKYNEPNGNFKGVQHEAMAQHYRDVIIQVLKEYDNSQLDEVYDALAWTGLTNTVAYSNLTTEQREDITFYRNYFFSQNSNCQ